MDFSRYRSSDEPSLASAVFRPSSFFAAGNPVIFLKGLLRKKISKTSWNNKGSIFYLKIH